MSESLADKIEALAGRDRIDRMSINFTAIAAGVRALEAERNTYREDCAMMEWELGSAHAERDKLQVSRDKWRRIAASYDKQLREAEADVDRMLARFGSGGAATKAAPKGALIAPGATDMEDDDAD